MVWRGSLDRGWEELMLLVRIDEDKAAEACISIFAYS